MFIKCFSKNIKKDTNHLPTIKISIWGSEKIGKTILAHKITGRELINNEYYPTVGVDFFCKILSNNQKFYFWDLGGDNKIDMICLKYIEISDLTIILYKENNVESIDRANYIINNYLKNNNFILVQNTTCQNFLKNGKMINILDNIGINELLNYIINIVNDSNI
jgi:small GTP-binding protein